MKVLIICDRIAPLQRIASIRWTKIAKYLKKLYGEKVMIDVLTDKKNYDDPNSRLPLYSKDILLEKEMCYFDNYFEIPVTKGLRLTNWCKRRVIGTDKPFYGGKDAINQGLISYAKLKILIAYRSYYSYVVSRTLMKFVKDKVKEYDVIISSYPMIWSFMLCYKMKSKNKNLKWIADFRDICGRATIDMSEYAHWHINYVKRRSRLADAVLHVDDFIDTHTDKRVKDYTVTNGYDPEEAAPPKKPGRFDLVYTGSIYGKLQDFGAVYKAINELIAEGEIDKENIRVIYVGTHGKQALMLAKSHDAAEYFTNLNEIPRYKVHELQRNAAILIQSAFNIEGDNCAWTGKMYEYMMSQKPIVYVVNGDKPNSFPSKYMPKLGGVCYESTRHLETYPELKNYILSKYREWEETGNVTIVQDKDYVAKYSYEVIAEQVWNILNSL